MAEAIIIYFDQSAKVACDENCGKAWGINNRPKVQLSEDENDYAYLSDSELEDAPIDPGTYEGGVGKPTSAAEFPTKWCVRECERCAMSMPGKFSEPLMLQDFSKRVFNMHWRVTTDTP